MNFYNYYITLCAARNVSPSKAGLDIGGTKTMVNGWKIGKSLPTDANIYKLSEYFGVSIDSFYECDDIKARNEKHASKAAKEEVAKKEPTQEGKLSDARLALLQAVDGMNEDEILHLLNIINAVKGIK